LADLLLAQGTPFIFVTGYSANAIEERFSAITVLQKPVDERALARALNGYTRRMTA
jgi:DNA-binding LytR/AlgR family response regulator